MTSNEMTKWGIGRKLSRISFLYLAFTVILSYLRPDIFTIPQIPLSVSAVLGTMFLIVGFILWGLGALEVRKAYNEERLLTTGVYAVVRNPMYSGFIIFIPLALALWFRSWLMLTVPLVAYAVFSVLIKKEAEYLQEKFGQTYLDYKSKVHALLPFPRFSKYEKK
jgi:protein-S-isoprenylcysteine O-methyltransferase Ste14